MPKSKTRDGIPFPVFGGKGERERERSKAHGFTSTLHPYMLRERSGRHEPLKGNIYMKDKSETM